MISFEDFSKSVEIVRVDNGENIVLSARIKFTNTQILLSYAAYKYPELLKVATKDTTRQLYLTLKELFSA
jgi:hypothetical protein